MNVRILLAVLVCVRVASAGVGDVQIRTDHVWYPGELAFSTFERLQTTQAVLYQHVVGHEPQSEEDRVLAAWLWRNTHFWHGEQGVEDLLGIGFEDNKYKLVTRDYWTGLFAHGFGLCGTSHAQWTAEMEALLGHNRARVIGVSEHNSFEVFLKGGAYGAGRWSMLDHDVSTVVFDDASERLLSIRELVDNLAKHTADPTAKKQRGWMVCGLYPDDAKGFNSYKWAEYLAGYAGPPPMVHLRRGESLRRYLRPGLEDGKTFVFWGRNYNSGDIPGPARGRTWVNQPEKMFKSKDGAGSKRGRARFANAVYTYRPDFKSTDYREGVVSETDDQVTFEFTTPYIIAATPASDEAWAIYQPGCRNGLVISGSGVHQASLSTDRGQTWTEPASIDGQLDLTDSAKGRRQYWLRIHAGREALKQANVQIKTVCQMNSSVVPRLTDNGSRVELKTSNQALVSAGPNLQQAAAHIIDGALETSSVTLQLSTPRGEAATTVYAAAHVRSGIPPLPSINYEVDYSTDRGETWKPVVENWNIPRRGIEPEDFWSQSLSWGSRELTPGTRTPVQVRFRNQAGKRYERAEMHLGYKTPARDETKVTFSWQDDSGERKHSAVIKDGSPVEFPTGSNTTTRWVQFDVVTQ